MPSPGAGPGPAADATGVLGISVSGADSSIPAVLPGIDMTGVLLAGAASAAPGQAYDSTAAVRRGSAHPQHAGISDGPAYNMAAPVAVSRRS